MKRLIVFFILFLSSLTLAQNIKLNDLTPTGVHEICVYDIHGYNKGCYNNTIIFSEAQFTSDTNHTYYLKTVVNKYDIGFSGTYIPTYILGLIPFALFIIAVAAVIGIAFVLIFMFLRRR